MDQCVNRDKYENAKMKFPELNKGFYVCLMVDIEHVFVYKYIYVIQRTLILQCPCARGYFSCIYYFQV